jgi:hypothetical protein
MEAVMVLPSSFQDGPKGRAWKPGRLLRSGRSGFRVHTFGALRNDGATFEPREFS